VTGPEHHREAERLVKLARERSMPPRTGPLRLDVGGDLRGTRSTPGDPELYDYEPTDRKVRSLLADAQVHATLALAAATAALGGATASTPSPQLPPPRHVTLRPDPGDDEDLP
jgi:hypothetical protein